MMDRYESEINHVLSLSNLSRGSSQMLFMSRDQRLQWVVQLDSHQELMYVVEEENTKVGRRLLHAIIYTTLLFIRKERNNHVFLNLHGPIFTIRDGLIGYVARCPAYRRPVSASWGESHGFAISII
ncbi:hypothetical protein L1987_07781 [Smallanthus sonchifolius]|uniref:Uncharacterized protein n=1 Tax=Smallanthus sonchifolius TaxID=185202 RepID=A0ACB9JIS3_9ASTR|nr:hypothetical protein L1987_07781 [Smallanthus sonchifolius]